MSEQPQNPLIPLTLGETLRFEREKQGLGIDQLAAEIRVRPAVLAAIESGETANLPRVYLKGYVRRYAQRLGISPTEIEDRIGAVPASEPPVQSVFSERLPRDRSERWFKATSYLLASGLVIALAWQFTTEAVRFSQGDSLPRSGTDDAARQPAPAGFDDRPDGAAGTAADTGERPDAAKSHLRASIASMQPARTSQQRRSLAEGAWAAVGSQSGEADAPAAPDADPTGATELMIATSADSWVEIVDGTGERIEMDLLRAGTRRSYDGTPPYRLLLGRASSIELSFNGEPVDLGPHTRGNVARVTLGAPAQPAVHPESPAEDHPAATPAETGASDQG